MVPPLPLPPLMSSIDRGVSNSISWYQSLAIENLTSILSYLQPLEEAINLIKALPRLQSHAYEKWTSETLYIDDIFLRLLNENKDFLIPWLKRSINSLVYFHYNIHQSSSVRLKSTTIRQILQCCNSTLKILRIRGSLLPNTTSHEETVPLGIWLSEEEQPDNSTILRFPVLQEIHMLENWDTLPHHTQGAFQSMPAHHYFFWHLNPTTAPNLQIILLSPEAWLNLDWFGRQSSQREWWLLRRRILGISSSSQTSEDPNNQNGLVTSWFHAAKELECSELYIEEVIGIQSLLELLCCLIVNDHFDIKLTIHRLTVMSHTHTSHHERYIIQSMLTACNVAVERFEQIDTSPAWSQERKSIISQLRRLVRATATEITTSSSSPMKDMSTFDIALDYIEQASHP